MIQLLVISSIILKLPLQLLVVWHSIQIPTCFNRGQSCGTVYVRRIQSRTETYPQLGVADGILVDSNHYM